MKVEARRQLRKEKQKSDCGWVFQKSAKRFSQKFDVFPFFPSLPLTNMMNGRGVGTR